MPRQDAIDFKYFSTRKNQLSKVKNATKPGGISPPELYLIQGGFTNWGKGRSYALSGRKRYYTFYVIEILWEP